MPGLFTTSDQRRARKREWLTALLISLGCHICPAPAGEGCDYGHDDSELLVLLDRDPPLFAHVPRIARVIAARPAIRSLILAQFGEGRIPEELTGKKT
jgi:hypothetical protein